MNSINLEQFEELLDRKLDQKLDEKLDEKFGQFYQKHIIPINKRLDRIENKIDKLESRMETVETRLSQLSLDTLDIKTNIRYLGNQFSDMVEEVVTQKEFNNLIKQNNLKYST